MAGTVRFGSVARSMVGCGAEWLSMVRQVRTGMVRPGGMLCIRVLYGLAGTDAPTLQVLSERGEDNHG